MKKIRTLNMLQDFLDEEFAWRLKEIVHLKLTIRTTQGPSKNTLIRATVPLLYAHWEGFVKSSSEGYLNFVNCQRLNYNQLASCFIVFGIKSKLSQLIQSKKSNLNIATVDFIIKEFENRAELKTGSAINTKSNLNSEVFENIAVSIGINTSWYKTRYHLMDESLLKRRNEIAHGNYLDLGAEDCINLADEVIAIIRSYKTDIENAATLRQYIRERISD